MIVGADQVDASRLIDAFVAAFSDYVAGPFSMDAQRWPLFLARQCVDLHLSRVVLGQEARVDAFALVASRGARWRLSGMGARPEARGSGAARRLLDDLELRARAAGIHGLELEVFEQNLPALRLYQRHGFETVHRLGWFYAPACEATATPATPSVISREDALAWLAALPYDDLPLQVATEGLEAHPAPWQAWRDGSAQVAFGVDAQRLTVFSLIDTHPSQAAAERLLHALRAVHPRCDVEVPPLQRQDLGGEALERAGFQRRPLNQWWMRRTLRG